MSLLPAILACLSPWGLVSAQEQHWEPLPLITAAQRASGLQPGGEGCQYPSALEADPVDGKTLIYGTDVGGVFRSGDGAKLWQPANLGWKANGAIDIAFDPRNPDRIFAVGTISGNQFVQADGVYLSLDRGKTWSQVLAVPRIDITHDNVTCLAVDPTSWDAATKRCRVIYFALQGSPNRAPGLYRSDDGGEQWSYVAEGAAFGGDQGRVQIAVAGTDGAVVVGSQKGVFRSADRGETWTRVVPEAGGAIEGLATVPNKPLNVWAARGTELLRSDNGGKSFQTVVKNGTVRHFGRLSVSPADPLRLATRDQDGNKRSVSHDGGKTWKHSSAAYNRDEFLPDDVRSAFTDRNFTVAWSATQANVCWATGPGDLLWRSEDGGLNFTWANNGINNVMIGGLFNFSSENPDVLYFGSQDYNGGVTQDAGKTWKFANLTISLTTGAVREGGNDSDGWGWVYGAYSPDGQLLFGGNREYQGHDFELWLSNDGGKTSERKVRKLDGIQVSYSDPRQPATLFCWGWRSTDRGATWARMQGCDGVFIASAAADRTLYGAAGKNVVRSTDHGATWEPVAELPESVSDVAYDHVAKQVWATAGNALHRIQDGKATAVGLPKDHFDSSMLATTVAVDPVDPRIVYAGALGTGLWVQRDVTVARSLDSGQTWERLTCNPNYLDQGWVTGGQMTSALRVHPGNRWLYAATCCYGWWRFPPPAAGAVGKPVVDRAYQPPLSAVSVGQVPDRARPVSGADGLSVKLIRDFGPAGFEYTYGETWKNDQNVRGGEQAGTGCVTIDATEWGGAGLILGGTDICPQQQTHLVLTLKPLPGNGADRLSLNLNRKGGDPRSVQIDLAGLPTDRFSNVVVALPGAPADYNAVEQIQFQGGNWSPGAQPLKVAIDRIGTTIPTAK